LNFLLCSCDVIFLFSQNLFLILYLFYSNERCSHKEQVPLRCWNCIWNTFLCIEYLMNSNKCWEEVTGQWNTWHSNVLQDSYSLPYIMKALKTERVGSVKHTAHTREISNV
jgi:hypothetical protein